MKDFIKGELSSSFFTFAAEDYEEYISSEKYDKLNPNFLAFILQNSDTFTSIEVILNLAISLDINVIIIDINNTNEDLITSILKYMSNIGLYEELKSYEDRLCFGKKNI